MIKEKQGALTAGLFDEPVQVTNPVKVQDLTFRDGHQSLFATRGRTEDFLPIAEDMDKVGYFSMEVWGAPPLTPCIGFWVKIPGNAFAP